MSHKQSNQKHRRRVMSAARMAERYQRIGGTLEERIQLIVERAQEREINTSDDVIQINRFSLFPNKTIKGCKV